MIALAGAMASAAQPGVLTEAPAEGRYVEVDGVFLVPYQVTIPGTDVTFWMEPIPGGETLVGDSDDGPTKRFELSPYWIGRHEVSWAEYRKYMDLTKAFERFNDLGVREVTDDNQVDAVTSPSKLYDSSFTFASGDLPDLPAVSMSQYAAKQYTKWLSLLSGDFYRLPCAVEWEHACRAGSKTAYSFGAEDEEAIDAHLWHVDNSDFETQVIGKKAPNAWGLYDMHGNASEWVLDAYSEEPFADTVDPDGAGPKPPVAWPTKLFPRELRGGSAFLETDECRSDSRRASDDKLWRDYDPNIPKSPWWFAYDDAQDVGFRIVRPYVAPSEEERSRYWDADLPLIQGDADVRIDNEGKGERGLVDPQLPAAIKEHASK